MPADDRAIGLIKKLRAVIQDRAKPCPARANDIGIVIIAHIKRFGRRKARPGEHEVKDFRIGFANPGLACVNHQVKKPAEAAFFQIFRINSKRLDITPR